MEWQPIEQPPEEGTEVLIWTKCGYIIAYVDCDLGWLESGDQLPDCQQPLCWMPLPPPPTV